MADEMTTYKRADKELIADEYGWVADIEYFEDIEDPLELVEERWALVSRRSVWVGNGCWVCKEPVDYSVEGYKNGPVLHPGCIAEWEGDDSE